MSGAAAQQRLKIRRIVWTGAIASITAVGAWSGAGLKIDKDTKLTKQKRLEATPAEKIAQIEEQRQGLVVKRQGLEKKLKQIEMRKNGATREESLLGMERRRGE